MGLLSVFKPLLGLGRGISLFSPTKSSLSAQQTTRRENSYQNHCRNLEAELRQEREKVTQLTGLKSGNAWERATYLLVRVGTTQLTASHHIITINRGSTDGLAVGQFVLGENSVIGVINAVSSNIATVKLTTDPSSKLGVQILHNDKYIQGVLQGSLEEGAKISGLAVKVFPEDTVYTYKEPWFIETPVVIGKVHKCTKSDANPLLWDVSVRPVCDVRGLDTVAVIIMSTEYED
ncbi:MAG: rod shape-determining protein MreC [Planctomycetota bacterium]